MTNTIQIIKEDEGVIDSMHRQEVRVSGEKNIFQLYSEPLQQRLSVIWRGAI